jgi:hypothetical protein
VIRRVAIGSLAFALVLLGLGLGLRFGLGAELSSTTLALGYTAVSVWLAAVVGFGVVRLASWFDPPRTPDARAFREAWIVLGLAVTATVLTVITLGFAVVPRIGGGVAQGVEHQRLTVRWTVVAPLRLVTPTTSVSSEGPALVVLRAGENRRLDCTGDVHWRITDPGGPSVPVLRLGSCAAEARLLPDSNYTVRVSQSSPDETVQNSVRVQRLVIASFGDSVASGEGNPPWIDKAKCHRSATAGPRLAADQMRASVQHSVVEFVHLACTGAWIDGVGAPREFGTHPRILPPGNRQDDPSAQVNEFHREVRGKPDQLIVLLSIGANDLGFGPIMKFCGRRPFGHQCYERKFAGRPLDQVVELRRKDLRQSFKRLAKATPFKNADVFITEYFDPLHDEWDRPCRILTISAKEAVWAEKAIMRPLNELVADEAKRPNWHLVAGITAAFHNHGWCAKKSWVVHPFKALVNWNPRGLLHPNANGQEAYGQLIFETVKPYLPA